MSNVTLTTNGLDRLTAKISRRINFLTTGGAQAVLEEEADALAQGFRDNVESFTPGRVADLKPATKIQKAKEVGHIYPILRRWGYTLDAMLVTVRRPTGGRGWVFSVTFPGNHPKGGTPFATIVKAHVEGTSRLPIRDFLFVPPRWAERVISRLSAALRAIQ